MSGGLDSSAAVWLLQQQGYEVEGATLLLTDGSACGSAPDVEDARLTAQRMGIPHRALDERQWFRDTVIRNFADTYAAGATPNPCIVCNREVKFGKLLAYALEEGFDAVATGHYARIEQAENGRWLLKKAVDAAKDQSYVLYSLTQHQLAHTLFPLGDHLKSNLRTLASERGWEAAHKPESQDICFIPDGDYAAFLEQTMGVPREPGDFVDMDGKIIGRHTGMIGYTVGQRKGLGVAFGEPRFVVRKDATRNTVTLGKSEDLFTSELIADRLNWISIEELTAPMTVTAKTRYSQREAAATIEPLDDERVRVTFSEPQRAITVGQAVVFYDGDTVVGGGTITEA
ncbi:MAG: tRNA 2-thiouridine(34) synthase MnmA [Clostridia bacterium]|nr:tRNA 2-thiouridine(34) synthase MnmA [Clostridia bacterium]